MNEKHTSSQRTFYVSGGSIAECSVAPDVEYYVCAFMSHISLSTRQKGFKNDLTYLPHIGWDTAESTHI